jgi:hypothetical protein
VTKPVQIGDVLIYIHKGHMSSVMADLQTIDILKNLHEKDPDSFWKLMGNLYENQSISAKSTEGTISIDVERIVNEIANSKNFSIELDS